MALGGGQEAHGSVERGVRRALGLLRIVLRLVQEIHPRAGCVRAHLRFTPPQEDSPDMTMA